MRRKRRSPAIGGGRAPTKSVQLAGQDGIENRLPQRTLQVRAILHCDPHRHGYAWHVEFDGERIVTSSDDPEHDACRILAARGYTGPIEFTDGITGKLRITIPKIEVAALYRMQESARGLRLVRRREGPRGLSETASNELAAGDRPEVGKNQPTDAGASVP
jgi:hypothetical protein